jgi:transposase InsO family protein
LVIEYGSRSLFHDRDSISARSRDDSIRNFGLTVLKSPPYSPTANAICERVIGRLRSTTIRPRRGILILAIHLLVPLAKLLRPDGVRADALCPAPSALDHYVSSSAAGTCSSSLSPLDCDFATDKVALSWYHAANPPCRVVKCIRAVRKRP